MKTKFLSVCLGISAVILSVGFFFRSFTPSYAQTNVGNNTNSDCKSGKYQMQFSTIEYGSHVYYRILVWDTETGKSNIYNGSSNYEGWQLEEKGLPANPLD